MELNLDMIFAWSVPLGIVVACFLLGVIFEWIIIKSFVRFTSGTKWKWDDIIAASLSHAFIYWFLIAGLYFAMFYLPVTLEPGLAVIINKVLVAWATFIAILIVARISHGMVHLGTSSHKGALPSGSLIPNAVRLVILIIGVVFILNNFGINIAPVIGALGIGGLAAALAFKDTLENLFSGFQLLATRKVRPGDYVEIGSDTGYVTNISWRETTIRDFNNNLIIIPNSKISQSVVTNFNLPRNDIYTEVVCGVGYDSDLEQVEELVKKIAKDVYKEQIGEEYPDDPTFIYLGFGDSAIDFKVKILVKEFSHRWKVKHPLIKRIHKEFNKAGINIPFPIRTIDYMNKK